MDYKQNKNHEEEKQSNAPRQAKDSNCNDCCTDYECPTNLWFTIKKSASNS